MENSILQILREQVDARVGRDDIEIVPDLQITSLYAVRIGKDGDFLVNTTAGAVERVRFDQWPPR